MDKIEKVRQKIDRMLDDICDADGFVQKKDEPRYDALAEVLDFLDALEEEPDKSLEEAAMRYAIPAYMKDVDDNYLHEYPRDPIAEKAFIAGAKWYKEQFEKNRLAYCDRMTEEEYDMETDFALGIIDKEHRQPTFIDAIKYGMRLQKDALMELIKEESKFWDDGEMIFRGLIDKLNSM